jgi:hypothetical protein
MSQISLSGNSEGTANFNIQAPATNTNRTVTLPDQTGTAFVGDAPGAAPMFACRAWVCFDANRDSTGAASTAATARFIHASGNVSSVIRNLAGDYTVNFATPMADTGYCAQLSGSTTTGNLVVVTEYSGTARTTSSLRFTCRNVAQGTADPEFGSIAIFR